MANHLMTKSLNAVLACISYAAAVEASGENLIANSSFELEKADYACVRSMTLANNPKLQHEAPELVGDTATHGMKSLFIPNSFGDKTRLILREVKVKPNTDYTFSIWMKSDVDKFPMSLVALSVSVEDPNQPGAPQLWDGKGHAFSLSKEWKRYSYTFKTARSEYYSPFLQMSAKGSCWLDAAQLAEGKECDYTPKAEIEVAVSPDKDVYALTDALELATITCVAVNHGKTDKSGALTVKAIDDFSRKELFRKELPMSLAPGKETRVELKIPLSRFGAFLVEPSFAGTGIQDVGTTPNAFAVVGKYQGGPIDLNKTFCVGLHAGCFSGGLNTNPACGGRVMLALDQSMDDYFETLAKMGCRIISTDELGRWFLMEPEQGKMDFAFTDKYVELLERHGIRSVALVGNFSTEPENVNFYPALPAWLQPKCEKDSSGLADWVKSRGIYLALPPMPLWESYLENMSRHYQGKVSHYQIVGEPNFIFTPEKYVAYLKAAHGVLKRNGCSTIGLVASSDFGSNALPWTAAACEAGALNYMDIASFHPYRSRQLNSPTPADEDIKAFRDIFAKYKPDNPPPLWNTEIFFLNDAPPNSPNAELLEPQHAATRFLLDLGEGLGQSISVQASKSFRRWLAPHNLDEGMNVSLKPSSVYVTYNALARLFEGAKPAAKIRWPLDSICYVYQRDGQYLAAFWKYRKKGEVRLTLPLGDQDATLFDLFGNPLPMDKQPLVLGQTPYYLKSKSSDLKSFVAKLERATLVGAEPVAIHAMRLMPLGDKIGVAIIVENRSGAKLEGLMAVSGVGVMSDRTPFSLAAAETTTVTLPVELTKEWGDQCAVDVAAASRTWSFPGQKLRPMKIYRALGKNGPPAALGDNASFSASHDDKNLYLSFNVKDSTPSGKPGGRQPWEQDCVELFLDPAPLDFKTTNEPEAYHERTARLFLLPYAPEGEQLVIWPQVLKLNTTNVAAKTTTNATGYDINLTLPLAALEIKGKALGFDIQLDDAKGQKKADTNVSWSSQGRAHLDRFGFGFIVID